MLMPIDIPSSIDQRPVPSEWRDQLEKVRLRIQAFQDRWDRPQIEQFVAADFLHLFQAISWLRETQTLIGNRFLEWGCGFAVVASIASALRFEAIGIEAESDLIREGRRTLTEWNVDADLIHGNFLPDGSEDLTDQSTLPSLGHPIASAYQHLGLELDDFSIVYSYPWPGEDKFHREVFEQFAAPGALLLCFCGPNDLRLWRKMVAADPDRFQPRSRRRRDRR